MKLFVPFHNWIVLVVSIPTKDAKDRLGTKHTLIAVAKDPVICFRLWPKKQFWGGGPKTETTKGGKSNIDKLTLWPSYSATAGYLTIGWYIFLEMLCFVGALSAVPFARTSRRGTRTWITGPILTCRVIWAQQPNITIFCITTIYRNILKLESCVVYSSWEALYKWWEIHGMTSCN